jgi:tetratricopeptide (TPR) repeat protein
MEYLSKLIFISLTIIFLTGNADVLAKTSSGTPALSDTSEVNRLNELGYRSRLSDPAQTLIYARKALSKAKKISYINGIAEAYRIIGIGKYYTNESESSYDNYLTALSYFQKAKNKEGEAKVYNNIGNLYRDVDYDKSLEYLQKSLFIVNKLDMPDLLAGLYLNIGAVYQKKNNYNKALLNYEKSNKIFRKLENYTGLTQCLQNSGVAYFHLNQLDKAELYLKEAIVNAKANDLNFLVAGANLTLASVYTAQNKFDKAEKSIDEGNSYAKIIGDSRLLYDFLFNSYELENKRKNYQKALLYLKEVYTQDSTNYKNSQSIKMNLQDKQYRQQAKQLENDRIILEQKYALTLFWASTVVAALAIFAIFLLIRNNRKSAQTNKQLVQLNKEVSQQKEDLDRINHSLEEIIDERTLDLKIKNNKLSEYSSHLSHQIRAPVATIKGLLILESDNLIEHEELVEQLQICVQDIDHKILNINENLNNSQKYSLNS